MRIIIVLIGVAIAQCPGGTFLFGGQQINCTCKFYTKRFEVAVDAFGVGSIPISFNTTIGINYLYNLEMNISFVDNKTDPTTSLDNNFSCIKPVFNKYGVNFVGTPAVFTPTIVSSYNELTGYRTWSYSISPANFSTQLISGISSRAFLQYAGYFGIDFTVVGIVQAQYQYSFTIQINRNRNAVMVTQFRQQLNQLTPVCVTPDNCIDTTQILFQFCNTSNCATPTKQLSLALNQFYWMQISITNNGFNKYLLQNPIITLSSDASLFRQYTPNATSVNATAGKTIISGIADFALMNVVIGVSVQLFPPKARRILVESTNTVSLSMTAISDPIDCIRYSSLTRVSCYEQLFISGMQSPSCDFVCCHQALQTIAILLMIFTY